MAKKNALGRGLGALISEEKREKKAVISTGTVIEISPDSVEANPFQPRTHFDNDILNELADSIRELGIIQPITVRALADNKFQLISGERRLKASRVIGLKKIPAFVRVANDQAMLEMALVENIQREDLNAIEIAISYQRLIDECRITQSELSKRLGKSRTNITNYLRMLRLPAEIQVGVRDKLISMGHARALINIDDEDEKLKLYYKAINEGLSVRKVEDAVRKLSQLSEEAEELDNEVDTIEQEHTTGSSELSENYLAFANELQLQLKTNIQLSRDAKGKGRIIIPFKSDEDLNRIISLIDIKPTEPEAFDDDNGGEDSGSIIPSDLDVF